MWRRWMPSAWTARAKSNRNSRRLSSALQLADPEGQHPPELAEERQVGAVVKAGGTDAVPGIDRELGGDLAGPQAPRVAGAEAGDRRWASRDLGGAGCGVPGDGGAAVLEPSPPEHPRQAAADPAGGGAQSVDEDPLRGDA